MASSDNKSETSDTSTMSPPVEQRSRKVSILTDPPSQEKGYDNLAYDGPSRRKISMVMGKYLTFNQIALHNQLSFFFR